MIRSLLAAGAAIVALALAPQPAAAASNPLEPAFKGTIISTYPDGRTAKLWLNADGTYRGQGRRGKPSSGRWSLKGSKVCLKQSKPMGAPFAYCTPVPKGTTWSAKAVTGEPIRVRLVPGR
ncbi:MAG TPA: hypothetical protein VF686_06990 [Brevundimonas sp.]